MKALGLLGEKEGLPAVYYMALRSAYWRLANPTEENDIVTARDLLWDTAQTLENIKLKIATNIPIRIDFIYSSPLIT